MFIYAENNKIYHVTGHTVKQAIILHGRLTWVLDLFGECDALMLAGADYKQITETEADLLASTL